MRSKFKEICTWIPTIVLIIIAVALFIDTFFPISEKSQIEETEHCITERSPPTITDAVESDQNKYLLNTNTKKFHTITCPNGIRTKETNRQYHSGPRNEIIDMGYTPCKNCNP